MKTFSFKSLIFSVVIAVFSFFNSNTAQASAVRRIERIEITAAQKSTQILKKKPQKTAKTQSWATRVLLPIGIAALVAAAVMLAVGFALAIPALWIIGVVILGLLLLLVFVFLILMVALISGYSC